MRLKKIWAKVNLVRSIPVIISYKLSKNKNTIDKDIEAWVYNIHAENFGYSKAMYLNWLLVYKKEFRNVFYNRFNNILLVKFLSIFYPKLDSLYISTKNIGSGLLIGHGFSTIIVAKSIGENCWINQQVTIGYRNTPTPPIIGNNVRVGAGAIVIGEIEIGDNSVIGAGAVVTKSVPANSVVVGNPAILLKKDGKTINQKL